MSSGPLLEVTDLEKHYPITEGWLRRQTGTIRAVDGITFSIDRGEILGLVGESGCGKSTTAQTVLGLDTPTAGTVTFDGNDLTSLDDAALEQYRRQVGYIGQDPSSAFNPRMPIGRAVAEPLVVHGMSDEQRRRQIVADTLEQVGLQASDADRYPHAFSGGEKQRIALARALVLNPALLVADEPTSALDGRTKSDVLGLIDQLRSRFDLSVLLISHDIDLVGKICDRVAVMYLGRFIERGETSRVLDQPAHPYTRALLAAVLGDQHDAHDLNSNSQLTGAFADASDPPSGCRFHPRCSAIIPPASIDLDQEVWRSVVELGVALETEWTNATEFCRAYGIGPTDSHEQLRDAFGLPTPLDNAEIEEAVDESLAALKADNIDRAAERLADVIIGPCTSKDPCLESWEPGQHVACHRYDPDQPGAPEARPSVDST